MRSSAARISSSTRPAVRSLWNDGSNAIVGSTSARNRAITVVLAAQIFMKTAKYNIAGLPCLRSVEEANSRTDNHLQKI